MNIFENNISLLFLTKKKCFPMGIVFVIWLKSFENETHIEI
jgi:hypothetical protein